MFPFTLQLGSSAALLHGETGLVGFHSYLAPEPLSFTCCGATSDDCSVTHKGEVPWFSTCLHGLINEYCIEATCMRFVPELYLVTRWVSLSEGEVIDGIL